MIRRATLAVLAALPVVAVTAGVLWFAAYDSIGQTPSSIGGPRNIAEAAGLGVGSEILRMLREGEDPHRVWPVRRDIISSTITQVSATEAAVWSRKSQVVELLDREGVLADPAVRQRVYCLSRDLPVDEISDYLTRTGPLGPCTPGQVLESVLARTKAPAE